MSAPKTRIPRGLLAKVESTYGTLATMAVATDGIQVAELFDVTPEYGFDGARPEPPGTGGTQIRVAPVGETFKLSAKVEAKGGGAAYSSSVYFRDGHPFMQAAGFTATGSFSAGTEKWTYVPTAPTAAPSSVSCEAYFNGTTAGTWERWRGNGGYCDMMFEVTNGAPGMFTFDGQYRLNEAASEQSVGTAITYAHTVIPPTAAPLTLTVNSVSTHAIRSAKVALNRTIQARFPDQNASAGHAGFHPGRRAPEFSFVLEDPLFATANYWSLWRVGTVFAASFQVGTTQYNRLKWTFAQAQVKGVARQNDDQVPLLEVTCSLHNSTPTAVDDVQLVTD